MSSLNLIKEILIPDWKEKIQNTDLAHVLDDSKLKLTSNAEIQKMLGNTFNAEVEAIILNRRIFVIKQLSYLSGKNETTFKIRRQKAIVKLQQKKLEWTIKKKLLEKEIKDLKLKLQC
ncbi:hypothetical protein LOD99_4304 [Oopsacas minuta]|uniref:Uncharacterized protein n=1 Tax=Oopsacas minuta TaxID=111878 RepID=A0AAV7JV97_9METZ|nr:hypothetical protein LOD99_4304 [Oopsacas minuta]